MKLMACFGGAAAVADEAVVMARRRSRRVPFRGRFLSSGGKGKESPSPKQNVPKARDVYDMIAFRASRSAPASVSSSASLSSSPSMESICSTSSSSSSSRSSSARPSSASSASSSLLEATPPPARKPVQKTSASGAAALLLCLVMIVFCGRFAAFLLAPAAFYLFPRRWPVRTAKKESLAGDTVAAAASASWRPATTTKRKAVMGGFLVN